MGQRVSGKESCRDERDRDRAGMEREREGEERLPPSPPLSHLYGLWEEEDPARRAEGHLQGAVHPQRFVAIDYFCHDGDAGSHVGLFFVGSACSVAGLGVKFAEVSRFK